MHSSRTSWERLPSETHGGKCRNSQLIKVFLFECSATNETSPWGSGTILEEGFDRSLVFWREPVLRQDQRGIASLDTRGLLHSGAHSRCDCLNETCKIKLEHSRMGAVSRDPTPRWGAIDGFQGRKSQLSLMLWPLINQPCFRRCSLPGSI